MNLNLTTYYHGRVRIMSHAFFWICYWLYHSLLYGSYEQDYMTQFAWEGLYLPVKMAATYGTLYFLLPRYFLKRRYLKFVAILGGLLIAAALFQRLLDYTIISGLMGALMTEKPFFSAAPIFKIILGIYPVVALAAFIKLAKYWYERDLVTQELETEKLEAELKFLKAQIHPHFLFNTLNNLYALTLKRSELAAEVVLKLSGLLSYMLYEGNKQTVGLDKELEAVETYISLEKIRYGNRLNVTFSVEGNTGEQQIPPMIIMPFIENTFKHGTSGQPDEAWIRIEIKTVEDELRVMVENSKPKTTGAEMDEGFRKGIGLKNVKRRLSLLYGSKHRLKIHDGEEEFRVELNLPLDCILKTEVS